MKRTWLVPLLCLVLVHCVPVHALELGDIPTTPLTSVFVGRMADDRVYVTWQSPRDPTLWPCYYQETDEFYSAGQKMQIIDAAQYSPPSASSATPWTMGAWLLTVANNATRPFGDTDRARCAALRDAIIYKWPQIVKPVAPLSKFVVAHNASMTTTPNSRPLLDATTFKQIGTSRAIEGDPCGDAEIRNTSGTVYHPHTNAAGVSGVTICLLRK